jgi:N-acetylated-alpha-linked acidic dipeptidase
MINAKCRRGIGLTLAGAVWRFLFVLALASGFSLRFGGSADAAPATPPTPGSAPIFGFDAAGAEREHELEKQFDSHLKAENLRALMKRMSARPHHTGSPFDKENAEFIASQLKEWGYDTSIEQFEVLFPTPKTRLLELTSPGRFTARLAEPAIEGDSTSGLTAEQLPVYNAYSCDGDVKGQLVYVNYGVPKDYEILAERGISVTGKIVIARYAGSWRGIKPKVAAEHGAIGCLIYSDPRDDGYFQGDVYPAGAWRNEEGAQRGSVADVPLYPGDPLTPGVGAVKGAHRLALKEAQTITKIPVMPISYGDALPLLRMLTNGPVAPEDWRGALPITYHIGPGPATVHLRLEFNWNQATLYDVIAKMPGRELPDEWIMRGNHHDAWVFGADDPLSGTVSLLEEARSLSELKKSGWQPRRTLVFAVWDGEEPGLLGSTEWAETHGAELKEKLAVYVNSDNNGRGFLSAHGSHTLERFVGEVARDVTDPQTKIPVAARLRANALVKGAADEKLEARQGESLRIAAMGSGSDYTPFLQHLGIASLDLRYSGENGGGSYHSIYDSFDHYQRFGDPGFAYGVTLAQTMGRVLLRLADSPALPLEFTHFSDTVARYVKEVEKLTEEQRGKTEEKNHWIRDGTLAASLDPTLPFVMPKPEAPVPFLNFAPLENAEARLQHAARAYHAAMEKLGPGLASLSLSTRKSLDAALMQTERAMTTEAGLPRRPWYKHEIYAPGFYTGYGVKTLPGVREAIESKQWSEATEQIEVVARTLEHVAGEIDRATESVRLAE